MAPRLSIPRVSTQLCFRGRPAVQSMRVVCRRGYADEKIPGDGKPATGPNQDVLGHVSEEAAAMEKLSGGTKDAPDLSQGTPVQEILKRDQEGREAAPDVLKEEMDKKTDKAVATPAPSSISTTKTASFAAAALARASQANEDEVLEQMRLQLAAGRTLVPKPITVKAAPEPKAKHVPKTTIEESRARLLATKRPLVWGDNFFKDFMKDGRTLRFGDLETSAFPKTSKLRKRYEPIVEQVTKLIMRHGKFALAQRNMATVLNYLRTSAPPTQNPQRVWVPGTPPASHLPLNPITYLTTAIDSVAPLVRIKNIRGAGGGGAALALPHALQVRQRRRTAVMWILDVISKKNSKGSGRDMFATKFAEEIVSIAEGKSSVWERRLAVHRLGAAARANKIRRRIKN